MKVHKLPFGPIEANCYIIETDKKSILIDPCIDIKHIPELSSPIDSIIITHCHFDHIANMVDIKNKTKANVYAHKFEFPSFSDSEKNGSIYFMNEKTFPKPDFDITPEIKIDLDGVWMIEFIHTPGHSSGSISVLLYEYDNLRYCFTGDTLFKESAGRTDLGGNPVQLKNSLNIFKQFSNDVIVCPGHGSDSTIGYEKKYNPFLN